MSLEEVDDLCLLTGGVKFRDDKKWKQRHATLRRLSPVANTLHLQLFKEGPRGLQSKASLSLDNFRAIETGFTLDRESNTLALLCDGNSIVLAFDAREALIQWQVKIAASVPYVQQFSGQLLVTPSRCKISPGPARLHVQDLRVSLVMGTPPRLAATWAIADLRRYGPAEAKYVLEGGSRCGRAEGLYVLGVGGGLAGSIHTAVEEAAQCRLQARRKLARKHDDSPCGLSRRTVSRSCSRDSTIARSTQDAALSRQASLQWSACSSEDYDLSSDPSASAAGVGCPCPSDAAAAAAASRPCGDGQSEVSAGSSGGSDSVPGAPSGRPARSGSGSGPPSSRRSPRSGRRCGADCACAVKISRSSLRRTGVLDGVGEEPRIGRIVSTPISPPPCLRYVDHVYEEPGEKRPNGCPQRPITACGTSGRPITVRDTSPSRPIPGGDPSGRLVRTVAEIHGCDPGYDLPRPPAGVGADRLSPEGVSEHLYEDPGPAEGWYQTPRPCAVCRGRRAEGQPGQRREEEAEGVYKRPSCPCAACGGHREPAAAAAAVGGRHRVDGSGRMPVLNADTGQLEVPSDPLAGPGGLVCPQIPSELILDTGLYSQPSRPAYAVIDRSRRTGGGGPLLPGLAPPPLPAPATAPVEPQYANTAPPLPPGGDPTYVNCTPQSVDGSTGTGGGVPGGGQAATVVDGATYVNCCPIQQQQQQQQQQLQNQHQQQPLQQHVQHVQQLPHQQQLQHQQQHCHQHQQPQQLQHQQHLQQQQQHQNQQQYQNQPQQQFQHHHQPPLQQVQPQPQPLYVNSPARLAVSPGGAPPTGDYLPMRPPSGTQPPPPPPPPPGEDYLEMSAAAAAGGRPGRCSLRRSKSAEAGEVQMSLRSASLGRKPMPSPKPARLKQLVMARGPGQTAMVEGEADTWSCPLPGNSRPSAASAVGRPCGGPMTSQAPTVPPLQLADESERQSHLSGRSSTSSSPRVALLSQKPRSGTEYQRLDRRQLLAQMSEPGPAASVERGCSVDI